ncbi:MAG TPA: bifunctional phosphoribosylaminoimidazolecarboxamide formyltransferase/IMP cyclohydrolase [Candidatus Polarisedimenticolaceae bacterium]|nr:bifunctional phosphoribosylaminoimidazolecarboxamide formyltransferase/IMP cyclohydrolase [Candidatus Polarisedimenticolaceae bacterium]
MISPVRRALISVHDKEGIVELARELHALGIEVLSTGGTAALLEESGTPVVRIADRTGFPEMLDGRVKTLHPRIHAGILAARSDPRHMDDLRRHDITPIDLVVVNLYPFSRAAADPKASLADVIEMIDVGGPSMVRAAAKNWEHVGVVVDAADYPAVLDALKTQRGLPRPLRRELARRAFERTAAYDSAIAAYLAAADGAAPAFPDPFVPSFTKAADLVYGENPHQRAAFYRDDQPPAASVAHARQLQGKPLSFNNILDFDAALAVVADLGGRSCAIVKHGNPCGVGSEGALAASFAAALACDPTSAFGGVIACAAEVDAATGAAIADSFYEGVIAPGFGADARSALARKKSLRVLDVGTLASYRRGGFDLRRVQGGLLVQDRDGPDLSLREGRIATRRPPSDAEWDALELAWTVVRHVKSNAIVYALPGRTVGIGAGQMSRVDAARLGIQKALVPLRGAAMASDAFFPFRDGLDVAAEAGITAVVQPGGSIRDEEVIAAADERGLAMVLTGRRHFRH